MAIIFSSRTLAVCAVVAVLVAVVAARPAEQSLSNVASDAMPPTTLLAQDLELMALQQSGANKAGQVATTNSADRPVRASPLAHIIADIIDVSFSIFNFLNSSFFYLKFKVKNRKNSLTRDL